MTESALRLARDALRARRRGPAAVSKRQRDRLADMVTYARANSPYYRDLYRDLQDRIEDPALLPVTDKKTNMAHFDDWVTDRAVTLEKAQEFAADPERVGERFEGKYLLATTSGTSGTRGIFVLDSKSQAVNVALGILRSMSWYSVGDRLRILARGGRQAFVMATGGHFVGIAGAAQLQKESWLMRKTSRVFPVHKPLPELVVLRRQVVNVEAFDW